LEIEIMKFLHTAGAVITDWRRGPIDAEGLAQLPLEKDILLFAASQSDQSAAELERLQHGLLTGHRRKKGRGKAEPFFKVGGPEGSGRTPNVV
jgi:hypothetical protein